MMSLGCMGTSIFIVMRIAKSREFYQLENMDYIVELLHS